MGAALALGVALEIVTLADALGLALALAMGLDVVARSTSSRRALFLVMNATMNTDAVAMMPTTSTSAINVSADGPLRAGGAAVTAGFGVVGGAGVGLTTTGVAVDGLYGSIFPDATVAAVAEIGAR